ncbi:hypothetical protein QFC21_006909 [Naganishia friedmannii]|uniref:Uncharacterized protein n=1 Tax=Naganishia friedmannii TaxID=89922 RepID=A0ACC2V0X0_9TREE|nr:hypothetical protein QFC21_006909 [Naganishia friedmannii]
MLIVPVADATDALAWLVLFRSLEWHAERYFEHLHCLSESSQLANLTTVPSLLGVLGIADTRFVVHLSVLPTSANVPVIQIGLVICVTALVLAAFSNKLWQTMLAQGLLYGSGQAFIVPLILSLPTQWFFAHRGLATGLVGGFAGCGGAINVIFARELIARFNGSRKTLGILAGLQAGVGMLALLLIKEQRVAPYRFDWRARRLVRRVPPSTSIPVKERDTPTSEKQDNTIQQEEIAEKTAAAANTDAPPVIEQEEPAKQTTGTEVPGGLHRIFRTNVFWSFWMGIFISTFGFLPPFAYITSYTQDTIVPNLDPTSITRLTSAWPLCCMGFGMFVGRAFVGMVADKIGAIQTFIIAMEFAGFLQMIAWHFATTYPGVICFSLVYGAFGGSGLSLIPVVTGQLFGVGPNFATLVGLGMLASAPGQLVGPTISGAILDSSNGQWIGFQIFSGAMMCFGGLIAIWTWWRGIGLEFGKGERKLAVMPDNNSRV